MDTSLWFPALMVFMAVAFATIALALVWEAFRDWLRRRAASKRLKTMLRPDQLANARALDLVREEDDTNEGLLGALVRRFPGVDAVGTLMHQSRIGWSTETFMVVTLGVAAAAALAVLLFTGSILFGGLAAFGAAWIPYLYAANRRKRIMKAFEEQLPDAIDLLTRAIRAGHPLSSGIRMVAEEAPPVIASEFRQTFEEQRFGLPFQDALLGMVDRVDTVDVRIFAIAVLIQREVGGNLAEILENLADTIRARFYIRRQLRVYTAQARLSGWILTLLPLAVGLILFAIQPDYILVLFTTTLGIFLLVTALILQVMGGLWIRQIVNIDI